MYVFWLHGMKLEINYKTQSGKHANVETKQHAIKKTVGQIRK